MLFTKPKKAVGLDIGTHSVKAVQMSRAKGRLRVEAVCQALVDRNAVTVDPVEAHANAVREAVRRMDPAQSLVVAALAGQTAVIRYPRLPDMPFEQIGQAIESEAGQNIPYDLSEVYLDWSLLDTVTEGEEKMLRILLVAAKHAVIEARTQVTEAAELQCGVMTVDSLALADAAECCDLLRVGESVALINIGLNSASIHFTKDGVSNFIRDVNWGAREFIQAVAKSQRVDYDAAERLLQEYADNQEKSDGEPDAELPEENPKVEEEERSAPLTSFDDPLAPLDEELEHLPGKTGASAGKPKGDKALGEVLTTALGRLISEVRRSFDYYEHQLYERPVDRLILSGGIAHLPLLRESLAEELGVERVEVANPSESALLVDEEPLRTMQDHPARYMVAVGLAARGMAEL
ncbi:MAG TPA: type IV pilus assembly protein PilM [Candidatus Hydrogenedentes bacterium]|mgnify:CR=1 FL=1|nr:type IV pilus assembly protein PilM [Candidatus Hydrogenedentota bacterium]HPG69605.1 type IV pilus assembly protein PilM [Candidatus Hydrogenedentota bacterium]